MSSEADFKGGEIANSICPKCHSEGAWRDGARKTSNRIIQRFLCRDCGYRFSESSFLSASSSNNNTCQVCADWEAKNLYKTKPLESGLAGATTDVNSAVFNPPPVLLVNADLPTAVL